MNVTVCFLKSQFLRRYEAQKIWVVPAPKTQLGLTNWPNNMIEQFSTFLQIPYILRVEVLYTSTIIFYSHSVKDMYSKLHKVQKYD